MNTIVRDAHYTPKEAEKLVELIEFSTISMPIAKSLNAGAVPYGETLESPHGSGGQAFVYADS